MNDVAIVGLHYITGDFDRCGIHIYSLYSLFSIFSKKGIFFVFSLKFKGLEEYFYKGPYFFLNLYSLLRRNLLSIHVSAYFPAKKEHHRLSLTCKGRRLCHNQLRPRSLGYVQKCCCILMKNQSVHRYLKKQRYIHPTHFYLA